MIRWTTPVSQKRITCQTEHVGTTKLKKGWSWRKWSLAWSPVVAVSTRQNHTANLATMVIKAAQAFSHFGHRFWVIVDTTICEHLFFRVAHSKNSVLISGGPLRGETPSSQTTETSYDCLRLQWRHQTISTTFRGTINLPHDEDKWWSIYGRPSCSFTSVCELRALSLIFLLCCYALYSAIKRVDLKGEMISR